MVLDNRVSYFKVNENLAFYLQNAKFKDWVDNSMIFLEIDDLDGFRKELLAEKYEIVRTSEIKNEVRRSEYFSFLEYLRIKNK